MKTIKKLLLTLFITVSIISFTNAQEIGVRFGDVSGGNVAIDAIFSTGDYNRLHADVSFGNGIGADLLWDFIYQPLNEEALFWYVGAGPYAFIGDPFALGILGEIGLEYKFKGVPIVVGADWRPGFRIIDNTDFVFKGFGLNVRYVIGN